MEQDFQSRPVRSAVDAGAGLGEKRGKHARAFAAPRKKGKLADQQEHALATQITLLHESACPLAATVPSVGGSVCSTFHTAALLPTSHTHARIKRAPAYLRPPCPRWAAVCAAPTICRALGGRQRVAAPTHCPLCRELVRKGDVACGAQHMPRRRVRTARQEVLSGRGAGHRMAKGRHVWAGRIGGEGSQVGMTKP
eukprot:364429-Chlamydomonas_euryale.AAC.6